MSKKKAMLADATDRPPLEVAEALTRMGKWNWLCLIATVSVSELVTLAHAYLEQQKR